MITNKNNISFYIGVTCPGCGGELELEEDFFVLTCEHCGSALRIVMPEVPPAYMAVCKIPEQEVRFHVDRYLKKHDYPLTDTDTQIKALYYPYWKINAILLKKRNKIVERFISTDDDRYGEERSYEQKKTEISLVPYVTTVPAGNRFEGIPPSLGMRTNILNVVPFSRENVPENFDTFGIYVSWEEVLDVLQQNVKNMGNIAFADFGKNRTELFHPVGSFVYFPYYIVESYLEGQFRRLIVDGVTGRVCNMLTQLSGGGEFAEEADIELGQLTVEFHRCGNCGFDLPRQQSYVYICDNCGVLTVLEQYQPLLSELYFAPSPGKNDDKLLPFWAFKLVGPDAPRVKRLMGGIYASEWLVVPAFKIANFEAAYRLTKRMSAAFPRIELEPVESEKFHFYPVSVGPKEAEALSRALIYREEIAKTHSAAPKELNVAVEEARLFFAPFHPERYFYVDSIVGAITFERSLVE